MKRIILASLREAAGKTSIITGIASNITKNFGYMKPLGDRLIYRRKKNWDYDSNFIIDRFNLSHEPESITMAFSHSKLWHVYDEEGIKKTLIEMAETVGTDRDVLFIECGKDLCFGASVHLDALSLARHLEGDLSIVISGDNDMIMDDITFIHKYIDRSGISFAGVIINKVRDSTDFENTHLASITDMGIPVLGIIPFEEMLTYFTISSIAERLFAKVIAGDGGMNNVVKNILVGAMSVSEAMRAPAFNKEKKLLITGGDRSDMILAALETDVSGIVLTGNLLPPPNIISKGNERNIPIILVTLDTFQAAKQIDDMVALLSKENEDKIRRLSSLIKKHVKVNEIIG